MIPRATVLAALALTAGGCGFGADAPALPPGRAVLAKPSLEPSVHLFGDSVVARLDLVVDRRRLDPDRIKLVARFAPYERIGSVRVARSDHGDLTKLRYTIRLRCLGMPCIPRRLTSESAAGEQEPGRGERKAFRFRPSRLTYEERGRERLLRIVRFPSLESVSRISESQFQVTRFPFQAGYRPLPEVTWLLSPPLLAALLVLAAVVLLAPAALLVRRRLRARRPVVVEEEPAMPPLERALLLVEWARDRPDGEDRRRALEVLAEELDRGGSVELADDARTLAWSPASPSPQAATVLVDRVREGMNGRPH